MPGRPYHMPCHDHQAIPYTMPCPPGYTIYHAMHRQAIPYQAMPIRPYHIPCSPGHTIYHAIPARIYHAMLHQAIIYIPCHAHQAPGHTIYLTMPVRSYHIPCHATPSDYFGKSCHLSKGVNGLVTRCTIACK